MNRMQQIRAERSAARKAVLDDALREVSSWAHSHSVGIRVFGSYARGRVGPASDLDILIVDGFVPERRYEVSSAIEEAAARHDVTVDVAFADMAPHLLKDSIAC